MNRAPLLLLLATLSACVDFDEYPRGDLCAQAERDELGRALSFPEWRICPALPASTDQPPPLGTSGADAGPTAFPESDPDDAGGSGAFIDAGALVSP